MNVGDAVVKLGLDKKNFDRDFKGIGAQIKKHQRAIGIGMVAAGGAILAAGALSIKTFAEMGDEVQKMALRTGFSTEALSEWRHAAEISGASIATLEKGVKRMSMSIIDAQDGLLESVRNFDKLGIAVEDLQGLSPEEQFEKIALAISKIEDPTLRAAVAQKIFGRAGTELLPLLAAGEKGIAELRQEAHDLGIVFDQEAANKAAMFNDAMHRMDESVSGVKMAIAEQLIPILIPLINKVKEVISGISTWMKEHPKLTQMIVLGATALGVLLVGLGGLLLIMPGIIAMTAAFGITLSAAIWPITAVAAAIAALIAISVLLWKHWDKVVHFFKDLWSNIKIIFAQAVKFLVNTVLQPFLIYIGQWIGNIVRVIGKLVSVFNKEWGAAIKNVADGMLHLGDTITDWTDDLIANERRVKASADAHRDFAEAQREAGEATVESTEALEARDRVAISSLETTEAGINAIDAQTDSLRRNTEAVQENIKSFQEKWRAEVEEGLRAAGKTPEQIAKIMPSQRAAYPSDLAWRQAIQQMGYIWTGTGWLDPGVARQRGILPQPLPEWAGVDWGAIYGGGGQPGGVYPGMPGIYGYQRGGIAMRPMLASIAEKKPEAVIPLDRLAGMMGGRAVNIYVELDGRTIAQAVGQPLVELIRLRTGARI